MSEEPDVLKIISEWLEAGRVPFMLTGSFALGYYGKPRMTRDLDFVVSLLDESVDWAYLKEWAPKLGVGMMLEEITK